MRYADRSYDGATWRLLKESNSLMSLISKPDDPVSITGWDDRNLWVLYGDGHLFRMAGGTWQYIDALPDNYYMDVRQRSPDRAICSGWNRVCEVSPAGVREIFRNPGRGWDETVREYRCHIIPCTGSKYLIANAETLYEVVDGRFLHLEKDKYKRRFIHRSDNTPLRRPDSAELRCDTTIDEGDVYAIVDELIVRYRDGVWYKLAEFVGRTPRAAWFLPQGDGALAVGVGDGGFVGRHELGGSPATSDGGGVSVAAAGSGAGRDAAGLSRGIVQRVTRPEQPTSMVLVAVWGTSPDKYWVMDENGTVWERGGDRWRTVVRGMYIDDVKFTNTWVSPAGTVFAVNDDGVWKLG